MKNIRKAIRRSRQNSEWYVATHTEKGKGVLKQGEKPPIRPTPEPDKVTQTN